ncbi:hypothetical protein [Nocardia jinanensis]|uniref:Uncharacterized protein n=1 Tax=Nocardia jinanensis TaxID=382504 RepID=A0A917W052_9NOCA|nr:hypothetical protein [Nocardia jinanensis]GGL45242.1 hypothetical protein GCM10011588_69940 [Nocardia jinanensis]
MTTPTPRPNTPGTARPGVPLPGRHLPGEPADPDRIRAEVRELLAELGTAPNSGDTAGDASVGTDLARRAHILDQAHEVLVQALATVDKI